MTEENKNGNSQQKCFFCGSDITRDEKLRTISDNNYLRLGVAAVDLENSKGSTICSKCWLSRMVQNRTTKKCAIASCTTSRRGLQSQRLCSLPLKNVDCQLRQRVLDRFNVNAKRKLVKNAYLESQHLSRKRKVARCQYHLLARHYHQIRPVPPQHRLGDRVSIIQKSARPQEDE